MLPHHTPGPQPNGSPASPPTPPVLIGVGIDTSRYGHYAAFLRHDLQPAAAELPFAESAAGDNQLRERLEYILQRHGQVHFLVRLDAAGQYADNLLHFLHGLTAPSAAQPFTLSLSCGDPQRNKNYRAALYGSKKSDSIEARAAARYALSERPNSDTLMLLQLRILRQVTGRLQAVVRQRTRLINQFHQLLALAFPELALVVNDLAQGWVLELVHRYPTATLLAQASDDDLGAIPYLPHKPIEPLLAQARSSIASLGELTMAELSSVGLGRVVAPREALASPPAVTTYGEGSYTDQYEAGGLRDWRDGDTAAKGYEFCKFKEKVLRR